MENVSDTSREGTLLLVIPPVVLKPDQQVEIDEHFANNIKAYLKRFEFVRFACPIVPRDQISNFSDSIPKDEIEGHERLTFVQLPYTYREDRHLLNYLAVKSLLKHEIGQSDYLLISPHAMFDWPTLAAKISISMGRSYDMEADWNIETSHNFTLSNMKPSPNKLRKSIWKSIYLKTYDRCLRHSSLALLQGREVFESYKHIAPNPFEVLNVQVKNSDLISDSGLNRKIDRIEDRAPLEIVYAGRTIDIKGPFEWLNAIHKIVHSGVKLRATWYGDGELLTDLRREVERLEISDVVSFPGKVPREDVIAAQRKSDVFLFCHKIAESPRCLVEALSSGCPIIGYESRYAQGLVEGKGGGAFVDIGNWQALADLVIALDKDREAIVKLVEQAYATAHSFDRNKAINYRIDLIKKYVTKPVNR